jgi:hypothetical protein
MDCETTIDVINRSGVVVYYLYAWSCTATTKGADILGNSTLANGGEITLTGPAGCWDFEADASGGSYLYSSANNMLAGGQSYTWTVY